MRAHGFQQTLFIEAGEGKQRKEALIQEFLDFYRGTRNLGPSDLVWVVRSEREPTLDRPRLCFYLTLSGTQHS